MDNDTTDSDKGGIDVQNDHGQEEETVKSTAVEKEMNTEDSERDRKARRHLKQRRIPVMKMMIHLQNL